ncbi:MAG: thioredoxin family protein [Limnochordales bacterium]|nr:thioredoxin family protein [Limnochordales bacterium]
MPLLREQDRQAVRTRLQELVGPVKLLLFVQKPSPLIIPGEERSRCQYCREMQQLLEEVVELSPQLSLEVVDWKVDPERARQYAIDKVPALVLLKGDGTDTRIRFFGIPSGYEFSTLIEDILDVARGAGRLQEATRDFLRSLQQPLHLQVFVTPTCPYCPQAVRLAHQLALESDMVRADMIEAMEFPELAEQYGVMGVPRTVINDRQFLEGAVPEEMLVQALAAITAVGNDMDGRAESSGPQ